MNSMFLVVAVSATLAGVIVAAWRPSAAPGTPRAWPSLIGLAGLIAALLAVGVASGTMVRHVVQVTPAVVALGLVWRGAAISRAATLPILTFWLGLMVMIWLFLLDVVRLISGRFTTTEIILTVAIGAACVVGLRGGVRPTAGTSVAWRLVVALLFAVAQLGALVLSMQLPTFG
jgi:hypothetical protein